MSLNHQESGKYSESQVLDDHSDFVISGSNNNVNITKGPSPQEFITTYKYELNKIKLDSINGIPPQNGKEELGKNQTLTSEASAPQVFISYSQHDKKYLRELKTHLAFFARNNMVTYWDDTMIASGTKWRDEINKGLVSAKIGVLLVSPEFFASNFIATNELPSLLDATAKRGTIILSVILRPSAFKYSPLSDIQSVNPPSEPLCEMKRSKRDEVWRKVAERIHNILNKNN